MITCEIEIILSASLATNFIELVLGVKNLYLNSKVPLATAFKTVETSHRNVMKYFNPLLAFKYAITYNTNSFKIFAF